MFSLRILNLENTKLGDKSASELCKLLADHPKLAEVNLAKNRLTDESCEGIGLMIQETYYLASVNLHWNLITYKGKIITK